MKKFAGALLSLLLIPCCLSVAAGQQKNTARPDGSSRPEGMISGRVVEKKSGNPVEYANIIVLRQNDSSMVNGALSDARGSFRVDRLPPGRYLVRVNFIGFGQKVFADVVVAPGKPVVDLGTISLEPSVSNLNEVTISGSKDEIEYNLDKKVVNVDKNIVVSGGTALDVMQTIPSVSVDVDGNVSLRGSSNVTIFVDGRPSGLTSLDQMPAAMIDKVEIITNPSARYDPDGMSGIINIVTKKKKDPGYNGMVSLNAGTGDKYNGSVNFNFRKNRFNIYTNLDGRIFHSKGYGETTREIFQNDTTALYTQISDNRRKGMFGNIKLGADYFIDESNTLSLYGVYNARKFSPWDQTHYFEGDTGGNLSRYYIRNTGSESRSGGYEINLDYRHTFTDKNRELTAALFFSDRNDENHTDYSTYWYDRFMNPLNEPPYLENSSTSGFNRLIQGQVDYVHPLGKWGRIETGYKGNYRVNDADYLLQDYNDSTGIWEMDELTSNRFVYTSQIHAVYLIYANKFKNFSFQAGVRLEEALNVCDQKTMDSVYRSSYFNPFPTLHLKYDINEYHAIQLSYSRRVNRPSSRVLNPFLNTTDPMNLSAGNPYLKPEFTHAAELGYLFEYKVTNLSISLFYRETENMITRVMTLLDSGVTFTTYENLDKGSSYGAEIALSQGIFKWWKINGNLSFFGVKYKGDNTLEEFNDFNYAWSGKVNTTMTFWKSLDFQINFNYSSPVITTNAGGDWRGGMGGGSQGRQLANYSMDVALKKDFLKNTLAFTLRLSDVFKSSTYDLVTEGSNFTTTVHRERDSRVLFIGVSYKINGGVKRKGKKPGEDPGIYDGMDE